MKRPVHKGELYYSIVSNLCNGKIDGSKFSLDWDEVTCKRCLALKGVSRESRTRTDEHTVPRRD